MLGFNIYKFQSHLQICQTLQKIGMLLIQRQVVSRVQLYMQLQKRQIIIIQSRHLCRIIVGSCRSLEKTAEAKVAWIL